MLTPTTHGLTDDVGRRLGPDVGRWVLVPMNDVVLDCDNLSGHNTKGVEEFLALHLNVHLHYTPTYSYWLNQVENWFSKIERDVIARGVFTSVTDLKRKLMRYIRKYNDL